MNDILMAPIYLNHMQVHREREDQQQAKPLGETKAPLNTADRPPGVADRDLHHARDLVVDPVVDQHNSQLDLISVSTYLVADFPFSCTY